MAVKIERLLGGTVVGGLIWLGGYAAASNAAADAPRSNAEMGGKSLAAAEPAYRIVYNVLEDPEADDYEVYVMDLDGTGERNLTRHPAVDWAGQRAPTADRRRGGGPRSVLLARRATDRLELES